ncbi:MAG: adenylosuccinate synthase, partial [Micrococcales bacterium]|nr:adenylosuccinate synthase [Micrococcales bacterium]
ELLRKTGHEYGTTTGRPRRCGWYDAPIARYSARINGLTDFVLTKLDVLTGIKEIPVCVAYEIDGKRVDEVPVSQSDFHHAVPIYENFPGWDEDITGCRNFEELPKNAQDYVRALEKLSKCRISAIGVGPARDATIVLHDMLG